MDITLTVILVCFVVFFIAGFVDAIAGGGGLITMPVLLLLGIPAHYTLGTGKARFQPRFNYGIDYLLEKEAPSSKKSSYWALFLLTSAQ